MTLLEMLDALEGEIARLRAEHAGMRAALEEAERRFTAAGKTAKRPKKKTAAKKKKTPAAPAETPKPAPKRQALGRGLAQIRRLRPL